MANINKNIIMQAGAAVANATNKAAGLSASTPEPGTIISAIQLVNGGRKIGPAALAHFTESVRNKLLSMIVNMEPIQSGTGEPSPDNVRPISGRTGLNIYVSPTTNAADATTYAVDWTSEAGTVYGGTVEVVTGVLTVTHTLYTITSDMISTTTPPSKEGILWRVRLTHDLYGTGNYYKSGLCDKYTVVQSYAAVGNTNNSISFNNNVYANEFLIRDDNIVSAADVFAAMPVTVYYPLATPITYQLTAQDIITLVGDNYIWSDSGDITITE